MTRLNIVTAPDPFLKMKSVPVLAIDDNLRKFMDNMLETMYSEDGAGLAAVQVGVLQRILVVESNEDEEGESKPLFMVNPEIIYTSEELSSCIEGCLSLPEQRITMLRPDVIKVKYLDYNNVPQEITSEGWVARAIQHEMDHLDGKLLIDYLGPVKKGLAVNKLKKLKKQYV